LDGQWSEGCRNIDQLEEARRLYYVAVTRAKKSLTLFSLQSSGNRFIGEIPDALIQRSEAKVTVEDPTLLDNHYDIINLDELYISYAAFFGATSPQTRALQKAQIGDLVLLSSESSKDGSTTHVFLTDEKGIKLARLSKQGAAKWLPRLEQIKEARIGCMHTRLKEDNQGDDSRTKASWLIPITEVQWRAKGQ
jgi:ATP-dependent DNA helicase RecQ